MSQPREGRSFSTQDSEKASADNSLKAQQDIESETHRLEHHGDDMLNAMLTLWRNKELCDVMICIDETEFHAHKIVLAASSGYLRNFLVSEITKDDTKIPLLGIKCEILQQLIEAMYSSEVTITPKTVSDLLSGASFLGMSSVVECCTSFLSRHLCVDNCLNILQLANLYRLKDVLEKCYEMASVNFKFVNKHKRFLQLRYGELQNIIPRQDLVADSESDIFDAVMRWIETDPESRVMYASRLMKHIRFPLILENELVDKIEACPLVKQIPEVAELVQEAVRYHLLQFRRSVLQTSRTTPRAPSKLTGFIGCGGIALKHQESLSDKVFFCDTATGNWKELTKMPNPRHGHTVAVLGGFAYIAGGSSTESPGSPSDQVWRYDAWSGEWLEVASMQSARESCQMIATDAKLYIVGGRTASERAVAEVEEYNPVDNTWSRVQPISSARRHVAVTVMGGKVYAVGGVNDEMVSKRTERYTPKSGKWEKCQPLPKARFSAAVHAIRGRLWLVGGATVESSDPAVGVHGATEIEIYSVQTNQWTNCANLSKLQTAGTLLMQPAQNCTSGEPVIDSKTGKESAVNGARPRPSDNDVTIENPRSEFGSCVVAGRIYLVGGFGWLTRGRVDDVEMVDTNKYRPHVARTRQDATPHAKQIDNYPLQCTGLCCAPITLYKERVFPSQKPAAESANAGEGCFEVPKSSAGRRWFSEAGLQWAKTWSDSSRSDCDDSFAYGHDEAELRHGSDDDDNEECDVTDWHGSAGSDADIINALRVSQL